MQERLEQALKPLRTQLLNHPIYNSLRGLEDLKLFTEYHVYAVWDFMSLVKKLQLSLTCTQLPWKPAPFPDAARLINEIVWGEESDLDENGNAVSHFEMYTNAMTVMGADTLAVQKFLADIPVQGSMIPYIQKAPLPDFVKNFLLYTFETVEQKPLHEIAAVFTFGREDLIPDMFVEMVQNMHQDGEDRLAPFRYYLERHIEVDGDQHGPMALQMINKLCEDDPEKWNDVINQSKQALTHRLDLWTGIHQQLKKTSKAIAV